METATKSKAKKSTVTKRGGYEPGPKSAAELGPPPKTLGPGVKPKDGSQRRE
jgi:hypothetical protein